MRFIISILLLFLISSSCKNKSTPDLQDRVLALREMNELATAEYSITKIVKANDNRTWFKFGDRKILITCRAIIKSGIDFSLLKKEDISITKNKIAIKIPPAKIISLNIPPEDVNVELQKIGFWRDQFNPEEQNDLLIQAERQIRGVADSIGILKTANDNAHLFISNFLKRLGFTDITINNNHIINSKLD